MNGDCRCRQSLCGAGALIDLEEKQFGIRESCLSEMQIYSAAEAPAGELAGAAANAPFWLLSVGVSDVQDPVLPEKPGGEGTGFDRGPRAAFVRRSKRVAP